MKRQLKSDYTPPRDLEIFCGALISEGIKGNKLKAERVSGVNKGKFYWAWENHPEFRRWFSDLCFSVLAKNAAIPPYALLSLIVDKDIQAIRTYYELDGRLKNKLEHSGSVDGQETKIIIVYPQDKRVDSPVLTDGSQVRINA